MCCCVGWVPGGACVAPEIYAIQQKIDLVPGLLRSLRSRTLYTLIDQHEDVIREFAFGGAFSACDTLQQNS